MMKMTFARRLICTNCNKEYDLSVRNACGNCFAALNVQYDYEKLGRYLREKIETRSHNIWRYKELLPFYNGSVGIHSGFTPLRKAHRLGEKWGLKNLFLKDDTVNPTGSFKDRPASLGVASAVHFGLEAVGCASTGNLAAATAAAASLACLPSYIFVPNGLDSSKLDTTRIFGGTIYKLGDTYDEVNRKANLIADRYGWGIVNINLRPFYVEGSKTLIFEILEQLNWSHPDHIVIPLGSGALLDAVNRGYEELISLGVVSKGDKARLSGTQPFGCSPIVNAYLKGSNEISPIKYPDTIVKSLAIGDPASGYEALDIIRRTGGWGDNPSDAEVVEAQLALAKTEGLFVEQTGGCALASVKRKAEDGKIDRSEVVVVALTGHGYKTLDTTRQFLDTAIENSESLEIAV